MDNFLKVYFLFKDNRPTCNCFAQIYHAPKKSDCYEHQILNIMSQSLKTNEK